MHALERNSQVPMADSLQTVGADASRISPDLASNSMHSQIHNLGLSMPIVDGESQSSQNMENNLSAVGVRNFGSLASTLPAVSNLTQGSHANAVCQDSSLQNNSSVAEKSVMKPKLQPGGMQAASLSSLQSSGQQSSQQMPDKQPQSFLGQHKQQPMPQLPVPHRQQTSMAQQSTMQTAQQTQPLTGQVSSDSGLQQNQLLQNIQVLRQDLGLMSQQNNTANLQQKQSISQLNNIPNTHQLQLGGGVSSFQLSTTPGTQSISSSAKLNQQQKVPVQQQVQQNVSSLQNQTQQTQAPQPETVSHVQPQLLQLPHLQLQSNSPLCDTSQKLPTSGSMLQQQNLFKQEKQFSLYQQAIQNASTSLVKQEKQFSLYQQAIQKASTSLVKQEKQFSLCQQAIQKASTSLVKQENQFNLYQQAIQKASTKSSGAVDWQEEVYQKIKSMKDAYFVELNALYLKTTTKLQMQEDLPQQPNNEQLRKLKFFKVILERLIQFLQISKNNVQKHHKDKLVPLEKHIINILSLNRPCNPTSLQPGQLLQPGMHNSQLQPLNPQTSAAKITENTSSALLQNMSSSVPVKRSLQNMSSSVPVKRLLTKSLQQPSSTFGLEQNSSPLSLPLPQLGTQNSQPQSLSTSITNFPNADSIIEPTD